MPSYTAPTPAQIRNWTGINRFILDDTDDATVDARLSSLITNAENQARGEVSEASFGRSDLTSAQAQMLQQSVAYHCAGDFMLAPQVEVSTGTQSPIAFDPSLLDGLSDKLHREGSVRSFQFVHMLSGGSILDRSYRLALSTLRMGR